MSRRAFTNLAYSSPREMVFGFSKKSLRYGFNLEVGCGRVIPEIKYFPRASDLKDVNAALSTYRSTTQAVLDRAIKLGIEELQVEIELPAQVMKQRHLTGELVQEQKSLLEKYYSEYGVKLGLRVTVADVRNFTDEHLFEEGYARVLEAFAEASEAGADVVSIESFGGKEVFSSAVVRCDIQGVIFATALLGGRDVERLWTDISKTVKSSLLGGDSACAHANSAMMLADGYTRRLIPHVFAAVVRAVAAVRTLVAYECGATGPGKDCAYENTVIKAITGVPISILGKASACAHTSLIGNITMAVADMWSNESVEVVKLFGGLAPQVFLEILYYDTLLLNAAHKAGKAEALRELLISAEKYRDPQTLILAPEHSYQIAREIVQAGPSLYQRAIAAALCATKIIEEHAHQLKLNRAEQKYLQKIKVQLENMPPEDKFIEENTAKYKKYVPKFNPRLYDVS